MHRARTHRKGTKRCGTRKPDRLFRAIGTVRSQHGKRDPSTRWIFFCALTGQLLCALTGRGSLRDDSRKLNSSQYGARRWSRGVKKSTRASR